MLDPDRIAVVFSVCVQLALFLRWLYRRVRNDELIRVFVQDMATNHLPHIYHALQELCHRQGIELPETPPVRWLDLNGKSR